MPPSPLLPSFSPNSPLLLRLSTSTAANPRLRILHRPVLVRPFSATSSSLEVGPAALPKPKWNTNHNLVVTHPVLSLMESCASISQMKQIQAHMTRTGLMAHRFPASRVLAFCALSDPGDMCHAALVFAGVPDPNTYMWNTMIRGYARSSFPLSGVSCFHRMVAARIEMDERTFVFALKCCELVANISMGEEIHCLIWKYGFGCGLVVSNSLMHFYVTHDSLVCARKVFDESPERDIVSWTTIIDGYAQKGLPDEAFRIFYRMLLRGFEPNEVTMIAVLSAISQIGILRLGKLVLDYMENSGINFSKNLLNALIDMYGKCGCVELAEEVFNNMESKDVFSWTCLMNAYAKCGNIDVARLIFDKMPHRTSVTWNSMISTYSQENRTKEAINLFHDMIAADVKPEDATLVAVLSACAQSGSLDLGRWIHNHYIDCKIIKPQLRLANALIDMYAKCGDIMAAAQLFDEMKERDNVTWNIMILAYAVHGYDKEALALYEQLNSTRLAPDGITFVGILSACCHCGLVREGRKYFEDMKSVFNIEPKGVHYACLIDLLGKVGLLEEAFELVRSMPSNLDEAGWGALLNACRIHGNMQFGEWAGEKLLDLNPGDSGIYVLMSNMYASRNKWDDVKRLRSLMRDRGVKKNPGCSSIEVHGKFHEFFSADESHVHSKEIYMLLDSFYLQLKMEDYVQTETREA